MPLDPQQMKALTRKVKPESEETEADERAEGNVPPVRAGKQNTAKLIPFLELYAAEIEALCDEVDYDTLADPELELTDSDAQIIQEGVLELPPRLLKGIEVLEGITIEDANTLGKHLEAEGDVEDGLRVGGLLFRVGQLLTDSPEEMEPSETEEEDLGDDEDDDSYMGEGDDA